MSLQDIILWRITVLILIFVNYILVSYTYFFLRNLRTDSIYYSILACDIVYIFDFILAVTIYFWKNIQLRMVNRPRSKKTLIFDAFLVIPYSEIYWLIYNTSDSQTFVYLRSISFLRLFHLPRFFRERSNCAGTNRWKYFITQYFAYFFLLEHTFACIWYLFACPLNCVKPGNWAATLESLNRYPDTHFDWYLTCTYFALINITTCGFGDLIATNSNEQITAGISMCLGFILTTGLFIGTLSSQFVNCTLRQALMRSQIAAIRRHLAIIEMDRKRIKRILEYYWILWRKKKGIHEAADINLLPLPLRMEICYDVNIGLLQCSLIFRDKPEPFLRTVSLMMKHEFYQPGEAIYHQHVIKDKMVCVASGVIEILSDEDNQSPIISFTAGTCIGEASLVLILPARATMRAASYTEAQVLYKKDCYNIIESYPDIFMSIREDIIERIEDKRIEAAKFVETNELATLSHYVSQNRKLSVIKKLKDRLHPNTAYNIDPSDKFYRKCLPLYRLSDNIKKHKEMHMCLTSNFPWILQPNSTFTWTWKTLICINTMFMGIFYPYYIAFERGFPPWLDTLSIFVEAINVIDIYFILTTAIIEKDRIIQKFKEILYWRMNTVGFYLDVFSTFYIEVFYFLMKDGDHMYYVLKLNRMLKIYCICQYFQNLEESLTANLVTIRLVKYCIYLIMCPYWFGTILYLETCFNEFCTESGWFIKKSREDIMFRLTNPCSKEPVLISVYYSLTCLSALGYGDILPGNRQDLFIECAGILIGIFIFGYCTAEFSATFTHILKKKTEFQEALFSLQNFMDDKRMNKEIRNRVLNFFVLQWYYNEGVEIKNQSLFYNATKKIHQDVLVKERMETLLSLPLFFNTDSDFLQLIATGSRVIILPPNEIVTYAGEFSREMYIIQNGYCEQQLGKDVYRVMEPHSHFGLGSLLHGIPRLSTVRTKTHVKLISIDAGMFARAISMFPTIGREFHDIDKELHVAETMKQISNSEDNQAQAVFTDPRPDKRFRGKWGALNRKFYGSFVNVRKYCRLTGENYDAPFRSLGSLFWMKYLLLPICILPHGLFIKFWVTLRLITSIINSLLIPYQQIQSPYVPLLDIIIFSIDFIAYVDLYLMMFVGYYGKYNQLIVHPFKTAGHYLKGMFIVDFILCFPWEILVKLVLHNHTEGHSKLAHSLSPHIFHCIFRILRILQVYRLPRAFNYLAKDITKKGVTVQVLKFVPFTIIWVNIFACLIIITSCKYYHKSDLSPKFGNRTTLEQAHEYLMICPEDSWIDRSVYNNYDQPFSVYLVAVYWCTSTLVGCGFGDVTAQDKVHLIIIMCMIICSVLFFGYVYASISSQKAESDSTLSHYQEMLAELKSYMEYEGVDKDLQNKAIEHYEYNWKRTGGTEPNVILENVHPALLGDAVLYMYTDTLKQVPLFERVDQSFFRAIGKELREKYFQRGETIIRANDVIRDISIIHRGKVEVTSSYNEMQAYMGVGGLFGNITPHEKAKVTVTITATRNLDILYLPTATFYTILKRYPNVKKRIEHLMEEGNDYIMPITLSDHESYVSEKTSTKDPEKTSIGTQSSRKASVSTTGASTLGSSTVTPPSTLIALLAFFLPHKWFRIVFLPDAFVFTIYNYVSLVATYVNSIFVIYEFAFQHHGLELIVLAIVLDVIFAIKMFLEIHKAYIDHYGEYVTDNRKIRKMYFKDKKLRMLDFMANLPICYFALILLLFNNTKSYLIFSSLRMITVLRCYYIVEFYKIHSNKLMVNRLYLKISTIILWITLIVHVFACIWYILACPLAHCHKQSWLDKVPDSAQLGKRDLYIRSIYYILNVLTTTGNEILPNNLIEIFVVVVLMLASKFFIGIFIGDVTNVMNAYSSSLVNYEYGIAELRDYLQNENVSEHPMEKVWHYVRELWTRSRGKQIPRLVAMLPHALRCDLMNEIYGQHLRQSFIFSGTEEAFLRQLTVILKHVIFFPGNYIVQHGDSNQCMYFIHRGEVDILTVHSNLTETIHDVLHSGEMFGIAQGLFHGVPHHFSFRARTTVDIIYLRLNMWEDLLTLFPNSKQLVNNRAKQLYMKV